MKPIYCIILIIAVFSLACGISTVSVDPAPVVVVVLTNTPCPVVGSLLVDEAPFEAGRNAPVMIEETK